MTYNTLAQPGMEQMVSKIMSIDKQLASKLYEKLTQPKILNRLITDPDKLSSDLCADLAGMLKSLEIQNPEIFFGYGQTFFHSTLLLQELWNYLPHPPTQ